jgi:hypothetical protein
MLNAVELKADLNWILLSIEEAIIDIPTPFAYMLESEYLKHCLIGSYRHRAGYLICLKTSSLCCCQTLSFKGEVLIEESIRKHSIL